MFLISVSLAFGGLASVSTSAFRRLSGSTAAPKPAPAIAVALVSSWRRVTTGPVLTDRSAAVPDAGRVVPVSAGRVVQVSAGRVVQVSAGRVGPVSAGRLAPVSAGRPGL